MRFVLLAADYDGTLAHDGKVDSQTLDALVQLRKSGRKLVLVTGRHLPDLSTVFPHLDLFDRMIVENGGVLYRPETHHEKLLCEPPNAQFMSLLRNKNVPFVAGKTVVATWRPHEKAVLSAIRELGLDLQVIFNKESVMVLPSGVNKGIGLQAALGELGISLHDVVSVGDAENDLDFLRISACSAAVANALGSVKEEADIVLDKPRGEGVVQLIRQILQNDRAEFGAKLHQGSLSHGVETGKKSGSGTWS
jgi:hydroxymethylpyrimidine pyrophosphatase-like HAD family hydrolase